MLTLHTNTNIYIERYTYVLYKRYVARVYIREGHDGTTVTAGGSTSFALTAAVEHSYFQV